MADLSRERSATDYLQKVPTQDGKVRAKTEEFGSSVATSPTTKKHQRFVLTDPVALKYLQEDPAAQIIGTPQRLEGYECYLVEQWACSRAHPTFIITTFTGDRSHSVLASVLSVPTNEESWSPRLKTFFKALNQYHARRRETQWGTLMVTNISAFPSSLTVIPIPAGDPKKHREDFFVNENLKRLGCSGRVGISLTKPAAATAAKFYQLYRTSEKIDLYKAVIELVKLCQVALTLFDQLGAEYADGLLCDVTEKAINEWWTEIGNDLYNSEPQDGVLGPTTVAALLGTLIGARNRLSAYGAQTSKDVFDVEATKRAIAYFQKSQRLPKTRRLDRATLFRLHSATAKAANSEGWRVPKVMKSTVTELGGKGGEMVLDLVGGREKAGIAEVETVDIEQFVQLVRGERAKWLWYGKARKSHTGDMFDRLPAGPDGGAMEFRSDEHGRFAWQGARKDSSVYEPGTPGGILRSSLEQGRRSNEMGEDEQAYGLKLQKRQQPAREESKRHIGKIRNAVGLRSHHHKHDTGDEGNSSQRDNSPIQGQSGQGSNPQLPMTALGRVPAERSEAIPDDMPRFTKVITETPIEEESPRFLRSQRRPQLDAAFNYDNSYVVRTPTVGSSIAGSNYHGVDLDELFSASERLGEVGKFLRRSYSAEGFDDYAEKRRVPEWWPRHLSFSVAEESLLTWDTSSWDMPRDFIDAEKPAPRQFSRQRLVANEARDLRALLSSADLVASRVDQSIEHIRSMEDLCESDMQELDSMYYPRLEAYQRLRLESQEALAGGKTHLMEVLKDIEVLGAKLDYEINALRSKVEDVEEGVDEFDRQVLTVETMVGELESRYRQGDGLRGSRWTSWAWKTISAFGTRLSGQVAATQDPK